MSITSASSNDLAAEVTDRHADPRAVEGPDRAWPRGASTMRYGGDYNPEQWSPEVWKEDVRLMTEAGVNLVSVGVFSWAMLEPREGEYDFRTLDAIVAMLGDAGIDIDLATPTAAPPAWFWKSYPAARPVNREGVTLGWGSRGMVSPSSPQYRRAATAITRELAKRYAGNPAVVMWHVHNEYGAPISDSYDDYSVAAFREWLGEKYVTLDALNDAWGTRFWGQTYGEWDEIDAPRVSASVVNQAQRLDFRRFSSDALLACFVAERDVIREYAPDLPITTNYMATNCLSLDYWKWSREVDVVANDHYLVAERTDNHVLLALDADLTRSFAGGRPWMLMEHSTSAVNWQSRNIAKRPGEMARNSLSHLARGADAIMFFQFRASRYGAEKFHSAMLPHAGTDSRIWREVVDLGRTVGALEELAGSTVEASVAMLWDVESFWAQDLEWRPSVELGHRERIEAMYAALWKRGVTTDFAHPHADLAAYDVVVIPSLYLMDARSRDNLRAYVEAGGRIVVSYFSGVVDENDAVHPGAHPGALRDVLGLSVEEFLPLYEFQQVALESGTSGEAWAEDIRLEGAFAVDRYADGPAAGKPAVTRNALGSGAAWYVSTKLNADALDALLGTVLDEAGIQGVPGSGGGLETVTRRSAEFDFTVLINHSDDDRLVDLSGRELLGGTDVTGSLTVPAGAVRVVRAPRP